MRKKLITAIIVVLFLIATAVGTIVYLENKPGESTIPESTGNPVETTEETVGLSLPTENPNDVPPEDSFGDDDAAPAATGSAIPSETEDPDANESPEDEF